MKKIVLKTVMIFVIIILTVTVSGCSLSLTADNLLTPPKLSAEQSEIYQALISSTGNVSLKYPKTGDYRSAFVLYNLDDEPTEEALVFYEVGYIAGESSLRVNFLDQIDGKWVSVYDLPAVGTDIEKVMFENLGETGSTSIIISYSMLNSSDKVISVLKYEKSEAKELFHRSYTMMEVMDIDHDGSKEMVFIALKKEIPQSQLDVVSLKDGKENLLYSVNLDPSANEYTNFTSGYIDDYKQALFIEHSKDANTYGTDIVYLGGSILKNAVIRTDKQNYSKVVERRSNAMTPAVISQDINGDGVMEIPHTVTLSGYDSFTFPEQLYIFRWVTVKDDEFNEVAHTFISSENEFVFTFPGRWLLDVTATYDSDRKEVKFWEYNGDLANLDTMLLSVKMVSKTNESIDTGSLDSYEYYGSSVDNKFYIKMENTYDPLSLTYDEIESCLRISNEIEHRVIYVETAGDHELDDAPVPANPSKETVADEADTNAQMDE